MLTRIIATLLLLVSLSLFAQRPATADVVAEWNTHIVSAVSLQNPFAQARFAAIAHLAMFEAINAVDREYDPYLGTIASPPGASSEAAAIAAAHTVLRHYFAAAAAQFDAARQASLAGVPDGPAKADGIAVGEAAAAALIERRASDGAAPPQFFLPPASSAGDWQLTPGCPAAGGILFHWQNVVPFGVTSSSQFRSAPPPSLTSGRYRDDYDEVKRVGAAASLDRPADRADVAQFYNTALAVHVWNQAARHLASMHPATLAANARAFALLNMAISDALVTVMETKYHYSFWRPATAIPAGDTDGNGKTMGDPDYTPFVPTPCFPSYPSAHASASYAGQEVARRIWGDAAYSLAITHPALPHLAFHYDSLGEITSDIDDARVYGGIHFRFDQEAGGRQGTRIGRYIFRRYLRPSR